MPVLKHAKKKLRQDIKRTEEIRKVKAAFRKILKQAKASKSVADITKAVSVVDKAAKKHIIHKNKAARIKSSLSKLKPDLTVKKVEKVSGATSKTKDKKAAKVAVKKTGKKAAK